MAPSLGLLHLKFLLDLKPRLRIGPGQRDVALRGNGDGEFFAKLLGLFGRDGHPQHVFVLLIAEGPPLDGFVQDNRPVFLAGNREQRVAPFGHGLAFQLHVVRKFDGGGFVGPGAPHLAVRGDFSGGVPHVAAFHRGLAVVNGDGFAAHGLAGLGGRTGAFGFVFLGGGGQGGEQQNGEREDFAHGFGGFG